MPPHHATPLPLTPLFLHATPPPRLCVTGRLHVTLLTKGPDILPGHNPAARRLLRRALGGKGIEVAAGAEAAGVVRPGGLGGGGGALLCTDGRRFAFDECLWCTEGAPAPWLAGTGERRFVYTYTYVLVVVLSRAHASGRGKVDKYAQHSTPTYKRQPLGLALDPRGFVAVAPTFQSTSHAGVFAAGDICAMLRHPRPKVRVCLFGMGMGTPPCICLLTCTHLIPNPPSKTYKPSTLPSQAGVFAVRAGPPLLANLRRALLGQALRPFTPQVRRFVLRTYFHALPV